MKIAVSVATLLASCQAERSPSVAIFFENVVTNAVESAPSAKRSRNRFGTRKAIRKMSRLRVAPKSPAKTCSRTSPRIRDDITAIPTTPVARVLTRWFGAGSSVTEATEQRSRNLRKQNQCSACHCDAPFFEKYLIETPASLIFPHGDIRDSRISSDAQRVKRHHVTRLPNNCDEAALRFRCALFDFRDEEALIKKRGHDQDHGDTDESADAVELVQIPQIVQEELGQRRHEKRHAGVAHPARFLSHAREQECESKERPRDGVGHVAGKISRERKSQRRAILPAT